MKRNFLYSLTDHQLAETTSFTTLIVGTANVINSTKKAANIANAIMSNAATNCILLNQLLIRTPVGNSSAYRVASGHVIDKDAIITIWCLSQAESPSIMNIQFSNDPRFSTALLKTSTVNSSTDFEGNMLVISWGLNREEKKQLQYNELAIGLLSAIPVQPNNNSNNSDLLDPTSNATTYLHQEGLVLLFYFGYYYGKIVKQQQHDEELHLISEVAGNDVDMCSGRILMIRLCNI